MIGTPGRVAQLLGSNDNKGGLDGNLTKKNDKAFESDKARISSPAFKM